MFRMSPTNSGGAYTGGVVYVSPVGGGEGIGALGSGWIGICSGGVDIVSL